jgi:Flp pilus assembly protein TadG
MAHAQRGITAVEFVIVSVALFLTLFGVLEVSRMMFARTLLEEGVRRGARLAAVCPVNDAGVARAAAYSGAGTNSTMLSDLTTANFLVQYLDQNGAVVANPATPANYVNIRFVRVSVQGYNMPLAIPFMSAIFTPTNLSSTLPAESLGVSSTAVTAC